MKKGIEWVKNHWFTAGIIAVFLVVAGGIFAVLMDWWGIITPKGGTSKGDLLRSLILCIGAIGGVYGLHLAAKRQEKFSKQVDVQTAQMQVQADQSFNERLGRGVELLAKDSVVMRCAGLQVLEDLAVNADNRQKPIVLKIIDNFFRDNAKANTEDGNKPRPRTKEKTTQDLQDALDILINLSLNDREKLLPKRLVAVRLNFSHLDFSHLDFTNKTLESIDFSKAIMEEANFSCATIMNVNFSHATIKNVNFSDTKIRHSSFGMEEKVYSLANFASNLPPKSMISDCDFSNTEFRGTNFCNIRIDSTSFYYIQFDGGGFHGVEFWRGDFCFRKSEQPVEISSDSDLPHFIGTDLGDSDFRFANGLEPDKFFELCYAPTNKKQDGIASYIDESRVYRTVNAFNASTFTMFMMKVFVKSDEDWSGQPAREWVEIECANKELEQAEVGSGPYSVDEAKAKVYDAEGSLYYAEEDLPLPEMHPSTRKPKPKAKKPKPKPKKP